MREAYVLLVVAARTLKLSLSPPSQPLTRRPHHKGVGDVAITKSLWRVWCPTAAVAEAKITVFDF